MSKADRAGPDLFNLISFAKNYSSGNIVDTGSSVIYVLFMMVWFTCQEYYDMIMLFGKNDGNGRAAAISYRNLYPDRRQPSFMTFHRVASRLQETGSVLPRNPPGRPRSATAEVQEVNVLAATIANPHISTRQIAAEANISPSSVWRALKRNKYHPFHVSLHQHIKDTDFNLRLDFCNELLEIIRINPQFLENVLWTDEANFSSGGCVNIHNTHYWAESNPHWLGMVQNQGRWSINVWCGVFKNRVIGPIFFEGTLTGQRYVQLLETNITNILRHEPHVWFQHDGAPPHYAAETRMWLDENIPNRWIGRGGALSWPPRSPDFNPLDFFLWGYVKEEVYKLPPTTKDDMKNRIRSVCELIPLETFQNVREGLLARMQYCIAAEGRHIEHVL